MSTETILVVDDEPAVRTALRSTLESEGWAVREAADTKEMMDEIKCGGVDLVTLDLGLGEHCGLAAARKLRAKADIPVIIISGQGQPYERATGLETGADDYIVKPFDAREVSIRVRRILRQYRTRIPDSSGVQFDHCRADLARGVVRHEDGRVEALTGLEIKLLELFVKRPAQVLSRNDINQALHGREWTPCDRTIDGHVARLRRKIEPDREAPKLIRSVRGVGYVFTGDTAPDP